VNAAVDATITPEGPYCETSPTVTLSAVSPGGTWSGTGITNAAMGEFNPATAGVGVHTITYTITGVCSDTKTTTITVNASSSAVISTVGPYCENDPLVVLTAVDLGGTWSGTGITNATNGDFDPSVAGVGTHTITYNISGACGDIQTLDIIVNSVDDATITAVGPLCLGNPVITLDAITSGGTWSGNGIVNATTGEFDASVAGSGIHTISYTTNGFCSDFSTTTITVLDALSIQAIQNTTICAGTSVNFSALVSGGDGNFAYQWTDPTGNNIGTVSNLTVTPLVSTTYTVNVTDGCSTPAASESVTVIVNPLPVVSIIPVSTIGCAPLNAVFTNSFVTNGSTCLWDFGDGTIGTGCGIDSVIYSSPGCYDVTLTVTANGCTNSQLMPNAVCVGEIPVAEFLANPSESNILEPTIEFTNYSTNATSYLWNFGNGAISTDINPTYEYDAVPESYMVCLTALDNLGCKDSICKPVNIVDMLTYYIPNTFTPDGNEFNQSFKPVFTTGFDPFDFNLKIFNRWGEVIWETNNALFGWDGTGPNGKIVEIGTYVWRVEFRLKNNDARMIDNGSVNVLR
jgi:gliding motility-associated-like protein